GERVARKQRPSPHWQQGSETYHSAATARRRLLQVSCGVPAVSVINRLLRQQLVREAEGYLDLASVLDDQWPLPADLRDRLIYRTLAVIDRLGETALISPQIQLIKGQALRVLGHYKEALQPLAAAAEADPQNIDTWLALGWCHKRV